MITSWTLENFKSVIERSNLPFGKLTLFTGANSAGKSTIIQSILLTTQTVQSTVMYRPVVLNGHIARLGAFQDLVSRGDISKKISVSFELVIAQPLSSFRGDLLSTGVIRPFFLAIAKTLIT